MFNWFWEFLYGLAKSLFQLADALVYGSRKLCGIDSIEINGEETDLLSYLFRSDEISMTFKISALAGILVVMFFAVFAILRAMTSKKQETTPAHIAVETMKTLLIFLFVPATMLGFMWICNEFVVVINGSLTNGGEASLGSFLFTACADGAWYGEASDDFVNGVANYANIGQVTSYISISDFNYMLAFLAGIAILFPLMSLVIMFVDRAISIVLLFIVAPFSISANVLDDGSHFKLWRDQVLIKFITGYGCIIALNIYALVVKLVVGNGIVFFPTNGEQFIPIVSNSFLNSLMKIVIIIGGAFSLKKIMAVLGNLVQAGAGSNELRDTALAGTEMGRYFSGYGRMFSGTARFFYDRNRYNQRQARGRTSQPAMASASSSYTPQRSYGGSTSEDMESDNKFSSLPQYIQNDNASGNDGAIERIIDNAGNRSNDNSGNVSRVENNYHNDGNKNDTVTNSILNGGNISRKSAIDDIGPDEDLR